jgi:hypothetical protein
MIGGGEHAHVAAGRGQELGTEQHADAGHADDHAGQFMAVKPVLDQRLGVFNLLVEDLHLPGELGHQHSGHLLARQGGGLGLGGLDGSCGQGGAAFTDAVFTQP